MLPQRNTRRILLAIAAGAALYVLIGGVFSDGKSVLVQLASISKRAVLWGLLLSCVNYALRWLKWQWYLRILAVPTWPAAAGTSNDPSLRHLSLVDSVLIFLSGFSLTVTPGKLGEILKSFLLRSDYAVPIARSAPIVLAERLTDLISLLLLSLVGAASLMTPTQRIAASWGLVALLLLCGLASFHRLVHRGLDVLARILPQRVADRLVPRLRAFYDSTHQLLRPLPLFGCIGLSIAAWFCECVGFYLILGGSAQAAEATLLLCTFVYALTTVAGALSFVPGGLGVTEGSMIVLLATLAHVPQPVAVAGIFVTRIVTLWFAVLIGLCALGAYGRRQGRRGADAAFVAGSSASQDR